MDKRSQRREPCSFRTYYQTSDRRFDCVWWWCTVRDVSEGGVGLVTARALDRGTRVAIELSTPDPKSATVVDAHVAHATPQGDGTFHIGCTFDNLSDEVREAAHKAIASRKAVWAQPDRG